MIFMTNKQQNQPTNTEVKDFIFTNFKAIPTYIFMKAYSEEEVLEETELIFEEGDLVYILGEEKYGEILEFEEEVALVEILGKDWKGTGRNEYHGTHALEHAGREDEEEIPGDELWLADTGVVHHFIEQHIYELSDMGLRIFQTVDGDYYLGFEEESDDEFLNYYAPKIMELFYNQQVETKQKEVNIDPVNQLRFGVEVISSTEALIHTKKLGSFYIVMDFQNELSEESKQASVFNQGFKKEIYWIPEGEKVKLFTVGDWSSKTLTEAIEETIELYDCGYLIESVYYLCEEAVKEWVNVPLSMQATYEALGATMK